MCWVILTGHRFSVFHFPFFSIDKWKCDFCSDNRFGKQRTTNRKPLKTMCFLFMTTFRTLSRARRFRQKVALHAPFLLNGAFCAKKIRNPCFLYPSLALRTVKQQGIGLFASAGEYYLLLDLLIPECLFLEPYDMVLSCKDG